MTENNDLSEIKKQSEFSIKLTMYDWHQLLVQLEHDRCVINRDTSVVTDLWEKIATQLHNKECIAHGSDKHRRLQPQDFAEKKPEVEPKPVEKKSWFQKIFGA